MQQPPSFPASRCTSGDLLSEDTNSRGYLRGSGLPVLQACQGELGNAVFYVTVAFRTRVIFTISAEGTGQGTPLQFSEEATETGKRVLDPELEPVCEDHLTQCECLQYASSLNPTRLSETLSSEPRVVAIASAHLSPCLLGQHPHTV